MNNKVIPIGRQGFTLIESLVVVVIMGVLAVSGMVAYGKMRQAQEMEAVAMKVGQIMNAARVKSITGEDDSGWKVDLAAERVKLMSNEGVVKEEYWLPENYSLTGPEEVRFSRVDGRVESCEGGCDFVVGQISGSQVYQFRVLFSGVVEY